MIKVIILALAFTVLVSANYEYCEVFQENTRLFFTHNERKNIDLSTYFKGYNLEYALPTDSSLKNAGKATIRNPVVEIDSEQFSFQTQGILGLQLLNVDRLVTSIGQQTEQGIAVAYAGNTVVVARGIFAFGRTLPAINSYQTYKIQNAVRCFKGVILNEQYDVAIDCQTAQNKNLMCLLQTDQQTPICYQENSTLNHDIRAVKSYQKITLAMQASLTYSYIFSIQTAQGIDQMFANLTTFSIYAFKDSKITLLSVITADTFQQANLGITDFTIDYSTRRAYLISALQKDGIYSSQLISFLINSDISDITKQNLQGEARSISLSTTGSFFKSLYIATKIQITQWNIDTFSIGKTFQIDPTDNEVTDIQSNYNYLVFTTTKGNQYLYRKSSSNKQLMIFLASKLQLGINFKIILSQYVNLHFIFTLKGVSLFDLNKGYLVIEQIDDSGQILLFAKSGDSVCTVHLTYQFLDHPTGVYSKTPAHSFSETAQQTFTMRLQDYFGGSGLQYNLTLTSSLNGDIDHHIYGISKFNFDQALPAFDVDRTIAIDQNSFYMAGTNNATNQLHIFKCQINDSQIACENKVYDVNDTISFIDGVKRTNGDVVFFLALKNSKGVFQSINARNGAKGTYAILPQYFDIDVLHVTQKFVFAFFKKQNAITYFAIEQQGFGTINVNSFTDYQLLRFKGFYPKEIIDDPTNPNVIYIRTITGILCLSISKPDMLSRHHVTVVKFWEVFNDWQYEGYRAVILGSQTMVLIQRNVITQFSVDQEQPLHTIDLRENLRLPLVYRFDVSTETISIMTENNNIFMIRMNQAASDSIIGVVRNYNGKSWSTSGGWAIFSTTSQAYRVPSSSYLEIKSNVKDQSFKVLINFNLLVKGFDDKNSITQNFVIEVVNYQRDVLPSPRDFTLKLPGSSNEDQFQIPIDKFFGGPINKYQISCSYCSIGKLKLVTPIRELRGKPKFNQINDMVLGTPNNFHSNLQDSDGAFNESIVVVLDGNALNILDIDNQLTHSTIFAPPKLTTCSKVGVAHIQATTYTILVLCTSTSSQQILRFQYDQTSDPSLKKIYTISDQRFYINNPSSIDMTTASDGFSWIFIHDKDFSLKTGEGNVKIFLMSDASSQLSYMQVVNGKTFGIQQSIQSINGFHIHNSVRVGFTIGKLGIGYSELNQPSGEQEIVLVKPKFINLKNVVQIDDFTLNNTVYYSLKILSYDNQKDEVNVLVTSNNAAHMVMTLSVNDLGLTFKSLNELYNPMINLKTLYWVGITDQHLMITYYNQSDYFLTNAIYHRTLFDNMTMTSTFITLNTLSLPIDLKNSFHLLVQDRIFQAQPANVQKLVLYDISQKFGVVGNYSEAGNFNDMTITASNEYNSADVTISIAFDNGDNTGGIKWYAILLIIAGCVLVIGLAVGFYFKNKAKKDKQKISLVTEGEQDEQV